MEKVSNLNIANLLTLFRILLVPVFFMLCFYAYQGDGDVPSTVYHDLARVTLVAIVFTDFADGYIARHKGITTPLGSLLDPLADKLFVTASFLVLASFGRLPVWLTIIVVSKDLLLLLGWGVLFAASISTTPSPSRLGKVNVAVLYTTIFAVLFQLPAALNQYVLWPATAALTVVSFTAYTLKALEQANHGKPV